MMQTNASSGLSSKSSRADIASRAAPSEAWRSGRDEPLLRELLAEAHARIRVLEEALDRVKNAV